MLNRLTFPVFASFLGLAILALGVVAAPAGELMIFYANDLRGETEPCG